MKFKTKQQLEDFLNEKSMMIISHSGMAKSYVFDAFKEASKINGSSKKIKNLLEEANKDIIESSKHHMEVLSLEASGQKLEHNILMMHSEDQMLTTQLLFEMSSTIVDLYENINKLKKQKK